MEIYFATFVSTLNCDSVFVDLSVIKRWHCMHAAETGELLLMQACVERECYPSPLNYYNFPKSCCT